MSKERDRNEGALLIIWLLTCIFGPFIGIFITLDSVAPFTSSNWAWRSAARLLMAGVIPVGLLAAIFIYHARRGKLQVGHILLSAMTLAAAYFSIKPALALVQGTMIIESSVVSYRYAEGGLVNRTKTDPHNGMSAGYYIATLADGSGWYFRCPTVCLAKRRDFHDEGEQVFDSLLGRQAYLMVIPHYETIIQFALSP